MRFLATCALVIAIVGGAGKCKAHDIYTDWKMPGTGTSCCSSHDCYATEAHFRGGSWWAKRREDGRWLVVPHNKVLHDEHTEDGLPHLCAPRPGPADIVFCFKPPGAGS